MFGSEDRRYAFPAILGLGVLTLAVGCFISSGCSRGHTPDKSEQTDTGPMPDIRVSLNRYGLPVNFFSPGFDTKCASQIIGYRFVVWLDDTHVVIGFNTSPNCRQSPSVKVNGTLRLLVFDIKGTMKTSRDLSYLADGNGELVADGEAVVGPDGTLLVRIESVNLDADGRNESKSGVYLLDSNLKDVVHLDRFLEQTTFATHALVFQDGFTLSGPRTYSTMASVVPQQVTHRQIELPAGSMDRKFGEHGFAFMSCGQELRPGEFIHSNVVHEGAKFRCQLNVNAEDGSVWSYSLQDGQTAAIVGLLANGDVAGIVHSRDGNRDQLTIWGKGGKSKSLPWLLPGYEGDVITPTSDLSRYGSFAISDDKTCTALRRTLGPSCTEDGDGRWIIFDRETQAPLVNRRFLGNSRAALSPDGLHYASFEAGEFRIYSLRSSK